MCQDQFVPRSKQTVWVIKTNQLTLYMKITAVFSEINTKHLNKLWAECRIF